MRGGAIECIECICHKFGFDYRVGIWMLMKRTKKKIKGKQRKEKETFVPFFVCDLTQFVWFGHFLGTAYGRIYRWHVQHQASKAQSNTQTVTSDGVCVPACVCLRDAILCVRVRFSCYGMNWCFYHNAVAALKSEMMIIFFFFWNRACFVIKTTGSWCIHWSVQVTGLSFCMPSLLSCALVQWIRFSERQKWSKHKRDQHENGKDFLSLLSQIESK